MSCQNSQNLQITPQIVESSQNQLKKTTQLLESQKQNKEQEKTPSIKKRKRRIVLYKCKVCKTSGRKSQVKICSICRYYFHNQCLSPEINVTDLKKFICQICQKTPSKTANIKIQQKIQPSKEQEKSIQIQKSQQIKQKNYDGFINISKLLNLYTKTLKKQEPKRKLYEFYKKYPYYFENKKIKFPIQDRLFYIYKDIFSKFCKNKYSRPQIKYEKNIPQEFFNYLLEIQVFFVNFCEDLKQLNCLKLKQNIRQSLNKKIYYKEQVYKSLQKQGLDEVYCFILQVFVRIYLNDVMDRNKFENIKFMGLNAFFNLLVTLNQSQIINKQFLIKCAPQIIKNLTKVPSLSRSFNNNISDRSSNSNKIYPIKLTFQYKIKFLIKLLRGLCDTDSFKDLIAKKSQILSIYTKEKTQIQIQLKNLQSELLNTKQEIKKSQEQNKNLINIDQNQKENKKKYDANVKKLQNLNTNKIKINVSIDQKKQKLKQITKMTPFVNSVMKYLGNDRFNSQYFFYSKQPNRMYIKYRDSYFTQHEKQLFGYIQGWQQLEQLKNWLNNKCINERQLLNQIQNLQKKQLFQFSNIIEQSQNNELKQIKVYLQLQNFKRQENIEVLIISQNLYKQIITEKQTIQERQKIIEQLYYKLSYQKKEQKQTNKLNQEENQNIWNTFFNKYPLKIWSWNQKIKNFWSQFLKSYINQNTLQNQANLSIIVNVFRITIKIYCNQMIKKKQRIQKKREKQLQNLKQKQFQANQIISSEQQKNIIEEPQVQGKRILRKRQPNLVFKQVQQNELVPMNDSNYKQKQSISEQVKKQKEEKKNKNKKKSKVTPSKNQKQKQIKSTSKSKKLTLQSQESNLSNHVQSSTLNKSQNKKNQEQSKHEQSEEQQFCEVCFQNIFFDNNKAKKFIKCNTCTKKFHRKCLDQKDKSRLKLSQIWNCENCYDQSFKSKVQRKKQKRNQKLKKQNQSKSSQSNQKLSQVVNENKKSKSKKNKNKKNKPKKKIKLNQNSKSNDINQSKNESSSERRVTRNNGNRKKIIDYESEQYQISENSI